MLKAVVNGKNSFLIKEEKDEISIDDRVLDWDLSLINERYYHILHDNKSYNAEIVEIDILKKIFKIKINGHLYEVEVKNKMDLLLEKMGLSNISSSVISDIKAPMPGLILHIYVEEGMEVKKGDPIMILEAMKMENIIKSSGEGKIKSIMVKKGESVEKNQILINFA